MEREGGRKRISEVKPLNSDCFCSEDGTKYGQLYLYGK